MTCIVSRSYPCKHPSGGFVGLHTDIRRKVLFPSSGLHNVIKSYSATNVHRANTHRTTD